MIKFARISMAMCLGLSLSSGAFAAGKHAAAKPAAKGALKHNILARLEAKPGKEAEVKAFLEGGLPLAIKENGTAQWFAFKTSDSSYGVFDTFADEAGRSAHLGGEIAKGLGAKAGELLAVPPQLEKGDVIVSNFNGNVKTANVKVGLVAILEAKPGKEKDVEKLLRDAIPMVKKETKTVHWYAFRLSPSKFGIFDTFADDAARGVHAGGEIAKAIGAKAGEILAKPPVIEKVDLIAVKP